MGPGPALPLNEVWPHGGRSEVAVRQRILWRLLRGCGMEAAGDAPSKSLLLQHTEAPEGTQRRPLLPVVVGGSPLAWMWFPKLSAVAQLYATPMRGSRCRDLTPQGDTQVEPGASDLSDSPCLIFPRTVGTALGSQEYVD